MSLRRVVLPVDDTFATFVAVEWCLRYLDHSIELVVQAGVLDLVTSFVLIAAGCGADAVIGPAIATQSEALDAWLRRLRQGPAQVRGVLAYVNSVESLRHLARAESADLMILATDRAHRGADGRHATIVRGLVARPPCPLVVLRTTTRRHRLRWPSPFLRATGTAPHRQRAD